MVPDGSFAGFSVRILLFDPGIGLRQSLAQRRLGSQFRTLLIMVLSLFRPATPLGASEVVFALEFYSPDFFREADQIVD